MAGWTSGWVDTDGQTMVKDGNNLTFNHNLGTTDMSVDVYVSKSPDGSTEATKIGEVFFENSIGSFVSHGCQVQNITNSQLTVNLSFYGYAHWSAAGTAGTTDPTTTRGFGLDDNPDKAQKYIKVVAISATDPVPGTGDLCKILSEDSGYQMFRNGLTIQWMSSPAFITESSQVVDFPIPFASKPFKVVASTRFPSAAVNTHETMQVVSWNSESVTILAQSITGNFAPVYADIIAIGIAEVTGCPGTSSDPQGTKISNLPSATNLKDDDLFVISKENDNDELYDASLNLKLSDLSDFITSRIPPLTIKKVTQSFEIVGFGHTDSRGWTAGYRVTTRVTNMTTGAYIASQYMDKYLEGFGLGEPPNHDGYVRSINKNQVSSASLGRAYDKASIDLSGELTQEQLLQIWSIDKFSEIFITD